MGGRQARWAVAALLCLVMASGVGAKGKAQHSPDTLRRLLPILGDSTEATSQDYYRISVDTVWYDAVRLVSANDRAAFIELIRSKEADVVRVAALSLKGRLKT